MISAFRGGLRVATARSHSGEVLRIDRRIIRREASSGPPFTQDLNTAPFFECFVDDVPRARTPPGSGDRMRRPQRRSQCCCLSSATDEASLDRIAGATNLGPRVNLRQARRGSLRLALKAPHAAAETAVPRNLCRTHGEPSARPLDMRKRGDAAKYNTARPN
jgi:hypothetical protein